MGKRFVIGLLALCLLSFCVQLALYPSLPETVPIHWNAAGEVDGWAGKPAVLLLGLLPFGLTVLFAALPKIDPKKESYRKHMKVYRPLSALFVLFFIGMVWLVMLSALEFKLPVGGLISAGIGLISSLSAIICPVSAPTTPSASACPGRWQTRPSGTRPTGSAGPC